MIAKGQTTISDTNDQVIRGYELLAQRLKTLGANISVEVYN